MRYLAICCFVMLGIALAHAIPTHKFQGLRSLARTKSERSFGVQKSLVSILRNLKAKTSRQLHSVRQSNGPFQDNQGDDSGSASECTDQCGLGSLSVDSETFGEDFDAAFDCVEATAKEIEEGFQKQYEENTGGEKLFTEAEVYQMWEDRKSETLTIEDKAKKELEWDNKALSKFEEAQIEPSKDLIQRYTCIRDAAYDYLEYFGELEHVYYLGYEEGYGEGWNDCLSPEK